MLVLAVIVVALLIFATLGSRLRGYVGRTLSEKTIAIRKDKQIPEKTYEWQLTDVVGNSHVFKDEKGKVIFLNFWATWCAPCLKEMPDIQKLYDAYGNKVSFLLVTQEDSAKVSRFVHKKGYDLPIYYAESDIPKVFFSKILPATYIIDRTGKIVVAETGSANWNSKKIRSLLDDLLQE